jgi:nucleoside-diphosphate-sugar epimerase
VTRVLVTGATGFVGRALVPVLRAAGHEVVAAVRDPAGALPTHVRGYVVPDIGPDTEWRPALEGVDAVVHLAARVHVMKDAARDPLTAFCRVNAEGTAALASAAMAAGVGRFVFVSTVKVMGERNRDGPFRESDAPAPEDAYALSKWAGEKAVLDICRQGRMQPVIVRPPLAYGPGVKSNLLALLKLCRMAPPLPLAAVDNQRSLIAVANLADALVACVRHPKAAGGTYFVSDGEDVSTPELIRRLGVALGRPTRLFPMPTAALRYSALLTGQTAAIGRLVDSLQVDDRKIRRELGWTPPVGMVKALGEMAAWFASRSDS